MFLPKIILKCVLKAFCKIWKLLLSSSELIQGKITSVWYHLESSDITDASNTMSNMIFSINKLSGEIKMAIQGVGLKDDIWFARIFANPTKFFHWQTF